MADHVNQDNALRFFNPAQTSKNTDHKQNKLTPFGLQFMEDMYLPDEKPSDATFSSGPSPTNCGGPDSSIDVDVDI